MKQEAVSLLLLLVCACSVQELLSFSLVLPTTTITASKSNKNNNKKNDILFRLEATPTKSSETNIANVVLESLEKRLNTGSLTGPETTATIMASDLLLNHLNEIQATAAAASAQEEKETTTTAAAVAQPPPSDFVIQDDPDQQLKVAVSTFDVTTITHLLQSGVVEMDETTVNAAFWEVVQAVDRAEIEDKPLEADVTRMLHHIFDADHKLLLQREQIRTNVTCMQPDDADEAGSARKMNYIFDDGDHKNLPLKEGRLCEGGTCCDACSRNIFPTFALDHESDLNTFPELSSLTFNDLETVSAGTIIQFVRLIERVRRTIAYEYGLDLKTILPLQAYSRKYVAGSTQQGGGGGEGDHVTLHTDEATHDGYHYSCVLYLSTAGEDFEGGDFVFNDPAPEDETTASAEAEDDEDAVDESVIEWLKTGGFSEEETTEGALTLEDLEDEEGSTGSSMNPEDLEALEEDIRKAGRVLTPFSPTRGAGVIFSSGWENMHEVERITSGVRYAVPAFFTTCPVQEEHYDMMKVGKPKTDEDIADDWLHLLLAHCKEEPTQSVGRVKELLMKWHYICTPLSQH